MVAGADEDTMHVARSLSQGLRRRGHDARVIDATAAETEPPPDEFSAVVFGTESGYSRERRALAAYIARHREGLASMPTGLFVVSDPAHKHPKRQAETFARALKWRPTFAAYVPVRDRILRSTARRMLTSMLASIAGSRDVSKGDELSTLADAIAHELSTSRTIT